MKRVLKVVGFCSLIFFPCVASDYDEDTRTVEELEQCPCVQEYALQKYGEDLTAPAKKKKKKKKKTKAQQSRQSSHDSYDEEYEDDYEDNFDQDQRSSSKSNSKNRSATAQNRNRQQQQQKGSRGQQKKSQNRSRSSSSQTGSRRNSSDNSWMHETAWMNLKNPFAAGNINMLVQNTNSADDKNGKSVEVFKDLEIKSRNFERPKYRINEKESIRFRQELEKYRQALA